MTMPESPDLYIPSEHAARRSVITPRVILLEENGRVPLLSHKGWWGLFGGHVTELEADNDANLLDIRGAFPTLQREVKEESGHDISPYLQSAAACLGLAEVTVIDLKKRNITDVLSPIYLCKVPVLSYKDDVRVFPLDRLPRPIYPDAFLGLNHLRSSSARHRTGAIFPEWLNHEVGVITILKREDGTYRYPARHPWSFA